MVQEFRDQGAVAGSSQPVDLAASRIALVMNKAAGKKDAASRIAMLEARLAPLAQRFEIISVSKGNDIAAAAKRAAQGGADIVLALGGDGTQCAVAGALAGTDTVMGVLPGGTFNYFARELGVGETPEKAIDTILDGQVRRMDVGQVNGRIFLNNASFGIYPEILKQREAIYHRWGRSRIAAYWSVLVTLRAMRHPMHLTLTLDGTTREVRTPLAFAARSAFQLESLGLDGAEAVRNGQFAFFLAKGHTPRALIAAAFRLAIGKVARGEDFDLLVADDILIETRQSARLVAFDGEKAVVRGPYRLQVQRACLSVIVPRPSEAQPAPVTETSKSQDA